MALIDGRPKQLKAIDEAIHQFPLPAYAWYVVLIISIANAFAYIDRITVAILTPLLQADLALSDTQAGLLQGLAFALFYTLFGLPLGWITDRWNRKWLLAIGMSGWSLMTALCGVATGFGPLFLARVGVGMGEGCLNPCASSLIGDYFEPGARSRAFGVYVMGSSIGNGLTFFLGGLLLTWLTAHGGLSVPGIGPLKPWRAMFILIGIAGLIPALLFVLTVREPRRLELGTTGASPAAGTRIRAFVAENWLTMLCHHVGISLTMTGIYALIIWMPTFFLRTYHWQPQRVSVLYGGISVILGIVSTVGAGWLATWLRQRGVVDAAWRLSLAGTIATTVCAALAPVMPSPQIALLAVLVAGFCANFPAVLGIASISQFVPNEMRGFITAIYYMMLGLLTSGLGPAAVGIVTDHVFHDKAAIGKSLLVVALATGVPACILLTVGLRAFRRSVSRALWLTRA
jgi:MFS family permease